MCAGRKKRSHEMFMREKWKKKANRYDLHKVPLELSQLQQEWVTSYCFSQWRQKTTDSGFLSFESSNAIGNVSTNTKEKTALRRGCSATGGVKGFWCNMTVQPCLECVMAQVNTSKEQWCHSFQVNTKIIMLCYSSSSLYLVSTFVQKKG